MAMVPTAMPLAVGPAATTGLQVQLGDDEERKARRAAVLRDMETRLAALGTISKPVHTLKFLNSVEHT